VTATRRRRSFQRGNSAEEEARPVPVDYSPLLFSCLETFKVFRVKGCQQMQKRRGAIRYNFGAIAQVIDLDEPDELVSLTRDLSSSGCFITTTTPLPTGARVRVRISHSDAEFMAVGKVTGNLSSEGMGIVFTEIEPNDRAILERWLGNAT
jgi:hypothetical protein